ncbi:hypothetical protein [Mycobacterium sp.]|uniref:hypothetical protein n=1 Tax=Mycobacterium sp. TaxID=1785 RepID=UPI003BB0AA12
MTTHEEHILTDSHDDPAPDVSEPPPARDESADETPRAPEASTSVPAAEVPDEPPSPIRESPSEDVLFAEDELADLRARWAGVQAAFVDDPKDCVHKADGLVSDLVEQLTAGFSDARSRLEEQWSRGEEASTEDLRLALMHYRAFFERLLSV